MLTFRDTTFCGSKNCKNACGRQWTDDLRREAVIWWDIAMRGKGNGSTGPVSMAQFCDENGEVIRDEA